MRGRGFDEVLLPEFGLCPERRIQWSASLSVVGNLFDEVLDEFECTYIFMIALFCGPKSEAYVCVEDYMPERCIGWCVWVFMFANVIIRFIDEFFI